MVVGIQTVPQREPWPALNVEDGTGPTRNSLAYIAAGEQIIAIQYRKVTFDWSSIKLEPGFLEIGSNKWVIYETGRGEQDDDILEASLKDYIEKEDIGVEGTVYTVDEQMFVIA